VSSPEDNKIDFEKLSLSEDLMGSLEPIGDEAAGHPAPEPGAEGEPQLELEPALHEEMAAQEQPVGAPVAETRPQSKLNALISRLRVADPYNVMLAIALAALFIGILGCVIELGRYGFHISAKSARTTTMSAAVEVFRSIG
jgi:hypothetical protein